MSSQPGHCNSVNAETEFSNDMAVDGSAVFSSNSWSEGPLSAICSGPDSAYNMEAQQQLEVTLPDASEGTEHGLDSRRVSIDDLPDEILVQIFSHLSFSELVDVVQNVCTRWRRLAHDADLWNDKEYLITCQRLPDFGHFKSGKTDEEAVAVLRSCPGLRRMVLWRGVRCRVLRALCGGCPRLAELRLHGHQKLSLEVLQKLVERCSRIHTLRISNELLKLRKFAVAVSQLQQLRMLELAEHSRWNPPVLRPLGDGCPQLTTVHFGFVTVDMEELRYFLNAKRNTLKSLCIRWTMAEGRCVLPLVSVCAGSLERLELLAYDVPEEEARAAFAALGSLKSLHELKMAVTSPAPPGAAAIAFQSGGLPELRVLQLQGGVGLDDSAVAAACLGCPALRELNVRGAQRLSDAAFSRVCRLRHLEMLDVSGCSGLGGALLPRLVNLPCLRALWLEELDCTRLQPGLSAIVQLAGLRFLGLNFSTVTGVPFDEFPDKLVNLRELSALWCRGGDQALHRLAGRTPALTVHFAIPERAVPDDPDVDYADAEYEEVSSGGGEDSDGALGDFSESEEDSVG